MQIDLMVFVGLSVSSSPLKRSMGFIEAVDPDVKAVLLCYCFMDFQRKVFETPVYLRKVLDVTVIISIKFY